MPRRLIAFVVMAMLAVLPAGAHAAEATGVWLHPNGRIEVKIFHCGDRLCGKLVWFKWPDNAHGQPLVDMKNPNPALRARPLLGLTVLRGLRRTGERSWGGGKLYNPDDGKDYRVSISLQGNGTMRVRAYVLLPLFGETEIWSRVAGKPSVLKSSRGRAATGIPALSPMLRGMV